MNVFSLLVQVQLSLSYFDFYLANWSLSCWIYLSNIIILSWADFSLLLYVAFYFNNWSLSCPTSLSSEFILSLAAFSLKVWIGETNVDFCYYIFLFNADISSSFDLSVIVIWLYSFVNLSYFSSLFLLANAPSLNLYYLILAYNMLCYYVKISIKSYKLLIFYFRYSIYLRYKLFFYKLSLFNS